MEKEIKYWVMEFEAEDEVWEELQGAADEKGISLNDLFIQAMKHGAELADRLEEKKSSEVNQDGLSHDRPVSEENDSTAMMLKLVSEYPVYAGETEEQAKERSTREAEEQAKERSTREAEEQAWESSLNS